LENGMTEPDWFCNGCRQWLPAGEAWDISQGDGFLCRSCAKPEQQWAAGYQQRGMLRLVDGQSHPMRGQAWRNGGGESG